MNPKLAIHDWKAAATVLLFAACLILAGVLRFYDVHVENPPQISRYATAIYITVTVFAAVMLTRVGVPLQRLGFGAQFQPAKFAALAVFGVGLVQVAGLVVEPLAEYLFGETRDLDRFTDVTDSPAALLNLLAFNWTVAAFGEELAFRIILMRGIAYTLGDSRAAFAIALVAQALIFGLAHAYQGPPGILGSGINGLIFGGLVLAARGSIWPAAIAHGTGNTIGIISLYLNG